MHPATRTRRLLRMAAAAATLGLLTTAGAAYGYVDGADTSHYQHNAQRSPSLDWSAAARDGVKFAFLKATEGSSYKDPYFKADWSATARSGIYRGAYHFARPSRGSAKTQADYFASTIGYQKSPGTLPPVLDLESTGGLSPRSLITWTRNFLEELETRTGRNPIIYVSPYFWIDHLNNSTAFHNYPLWVAHYGVSQPKIPGGWPTWSFWQSTSTGRIQGISGSVDKDVFNGTMTQLQKFALTYKAPAKPRPSLELTASNDAPTVGQSIGLRGHLLSGSTPLTGATVQLQGEPEGSRAWTTVATVRTGKAGGYRTRVQINTPGSFRAVYAGSDSYKPATSSPVAVTLTPLQTTATLATSDDALRAGASLGLSGTLMQGDAPMAGRSLTVYVRPEGASGWTRSGRVTTDQSGAFQATRTVMHTATWRVRYAGETGYTGARVDAGPVTVKPNPTQLSFSVHNSAPYQGQRITMSGKLLTDGAPVAGQSVVVERRPDGKRRWVDAGTVETDSQGRYSLRQVPTESADYRAAFAGNAMYGSSRTPLVAVGISPPERTRMTLTARRTQLRAGRATRLDGALTSHGAGVHRVVRLYQRHPGQTNWQFVYKTTTRLPDGDCRIVVSPRHTSIYQLRFIGGNRLAPAQRSVRITVS